MKVSSTDFQYLQHQVGFLSRVANADDAVAKNLDESHKNNIRSRDTPNNIFHLLRSGTVDQKSN